MFSLTGFPQSRRRPCATKVVRFLSPPLDARDLGSERMPLSSSVFCMTAHASHGRAELICAHCRFRSSSSLLMIDHTIRGFRPPSARRTCPHEPSTVRGETSRSGLVDLDIKSSTLSILAYMLHAASKSSDSVVSTWHLLPNPPGMGVHTAHTRPLMLSIYDPKTANKF